MIPSSASEPLTNLAHSALFTAARQWNKDVLVAHVTAALASTVHWG
jgi:hypothetical protein